MQRLARVLAAVLAVALIAGAAVVFVRAQVLKSAPSPIIEPRVQSRSFSPQAESERRRQVRFSFALREDGPAAVRILDADDRPIADPDVEQRGRRVVAVWDGRLPDGELAADGLYRFLIDLPGQRRSIRMPDPIRLDATPPTIVSDAASGQRISPGLEGSAGTYAFRLEADEPVRIVLDVRRIDPDGAAQLIRRETRPRWTRSRDLAWAADRGRGPATRIGPYVERGSYIVGWRAQDRGGNVVVAPTAVEPGALAPAQVVGVETVALRPGSLAPVTLLADVDLVRHRPGATFPGPVEARASGAPGAIALPAADPGLYAVEATAGAWSAWAPEAVPGRAPVLLMAPLYSWQAANPDDADLSGFPDVPPAPLGLDRPLPEGITAGIAALARTGAEARRTLRRPLGSVTDASIERRGVPRTARVVVIAEAPVWTEGLVRTLRAFQRRGGIVVVLDDASLTRLAVRSGGAIVLGADARPGSSALPVVRSLRAARAALTSR